MREVILHKWYKDLTRKTDFLESWSWFKFNNLKLVLCMTLKLYSCVEKGLKPRVRTCCRKLPASHFPPPPILNRVESELTGALPVKTIKKKKNRFHCFIDCSVEVTNIVTVIIPKMCLGTLNHLFLPMWNRGG